MLTLNILARALRARIIKFELETDSRINLDLLSPDLPLILIDHKHGIYRLSSSAGEPELRPDRYN